MMGLDIVAAVFLAAGCFFSLTGAVGIIRMPDFYSRIHPAGNNDTLAQSLILAGLCFLVWPRYDAMVIVKLCLIMAALFLTAPVATHAITRAAHLSGLEPWKEDRRDG